MIGDARLRFMTTNISGVSNFSLCRLLAPICINSSSAHVSCCNSPVSVEICFHSRHACMHASTGDEKASLYLRADALAVDHSLDRPVWLQVSCRPPSGMCILVAFVSKLLRPPCFTSPGTYVLSPRLIHPSITCAVLYNFNIVNGVFSITLIKVYEV